LSRVANALERPQCTMLSSLGQDETFVGKRLKEEREYSVSLRISAEGEKAGLDPLQYYASLGDSTDLGEYASLCAGLPASVPDLCRVVQGLLIHILETWRYGIELPAARLSEVSIGTARGLLKRILELDAQPLTVQRWPVKRVVATCHDFSILLCTMLRWQGRPARARAGFAAYLMPGMYVDHWVCEYWQPDSRRWMIADPQLDGVHCQGYGIAFDPNAVPPDQYLTGARAWQECRAERMDPQSFGFSRWWGMAYLRHVLLRDLLALNKREGLPWEDAGLRIGDESEITDQDRARLDEIAQQAAAGNGAFAALRSSYEEVVSLRRPPDCLPWRLDEVQGRVPRCGGIT
jgi:hypothetical protein